MKIKSKKLRDEFKLSHVLWFFIGILVTVVFNWIVYKEPKRITAPGVSTLVAMSAFMLALWSAFKVNKWLNNKINDAAFKRTDDFLYASSEIIHILQQLIVFVKITRLNKSKDDFDQTLSEIKFYSKNIFEKMKDVHSNMSTFQTWGIIFNQRKNSLTHQDILDL